MKNKLLLLVVSFSFLVGIFFTQNNAFGEPRPAGPKGIRSLLSMERAMQRIDAAENALLSTEINGDQRLGIYALMKEAGADFHEAGSTYLKGNDVNSTGVSGVDFASAIEKWWSDHELFLKLAGDFDKGQSLQTYRAMSVQALEKNAASLSAALVLLQGEIDHELQRIGGDGRNAATASSGSSVKDGFVWGQFLVFTVAAALMLLVTWLLRPRKHHRLSLEVGSYPPVMATPPRGGTRSSTQ